MNIRDDAGASKVRKADASESRSAHGYVKAGAASGANASVCLEGVNDQVSGLAPGEAWLGNAGAVTQTPPVSGSGGIAQIIGRQAGAATELDFEKGRPVYLAGE